MPYHGAVATERSGGPLVSYGRMPVPTSSSSSSASRYAPSSLGGSTVASSYRSSLDRPYYSSSTGSYSTRSTLPRSPLTSEYRLSYSSSTSLSSRSTAASAGHSRQSSLSEDAAASKTRATPPPRAPSTPTPRRSTVEQDLYSKYSPSNYVPNADRGASKADPSDKGSVRSRSTKNAVNEVSYGRLPRAVGGCSVSTLERRVRQVSVDEARPPRDNNNSATNPASVAAEPRTNPSVADNSGASAAVEVKEDDNGNEGRRLSVAEIRRRFDAPPPPPPPPPLPEGAAGVGAGMNGNHPSPCPARKALFKGGEGISSSEEEEDSDDSEGGARGGRQGAAAAVRVAQPARQRGTWAATAAEDSDTDTSPSNARSHTKKANGLTGLVNIGNTCFMNSVVQCLSNTKPLVEYLLSDSYQADLNNNSGMKGKLISAFSEMVRELWAGSGSVASPVAFKAQISKYAPRFTGYAQQDAQEFLRFLLEGVHEDVNRVRTRPRQLPDAADGNSSPDQKAVEQWKRYLRQDDSKIVDLFVGQLRSTLRCSACGHCSVTFDPFWDLQLPIPSRTGQLRLQQCLDHFTTEEVLDGNEKAHCAQCEKNQKSTKSFTIQKFPKILVLQLNRFSPTDRYRRKLSVTVDFPLDHLDLSNYAAVRTGSADCTYALYGVSNHSGSPSFGHYTAYCKHPHTGEWHEYNDSRVSSISARSVVSSEAYLLFYELSGRSSHL